MIDHIKKIDKRFILFLFVGGINTVFGYCVFAFFIFLGLHYSLALVFGTIIAILFNFKTTSAIVFKNQDNKLIFKFFMVYFVVYIINYLGLRAFNARHISNYIAGAILILPVAVISFILMRKFVFEGKTSIKLQD